MTTTRSVRPAMTPMSWVMSKIDIFSSWRKLSRMSRIWAWIVTSSAVVGSSAMSSLGEQVSPMAMMTRWRRPPDNSKGYWFEALGRSGHVDHLKNFEGALARLFIGRSAVDTQSLTDLSTDLRRRD